MPPLTQQDYLDSVAIELGSPLVGGPLPDAFTAQLMGALAARLPVLWAMNATRVGNASATVIALYTKRQGLTELMGQLRQFVDEQAGRGVLRLNYSQLFKNCLQLYQLTDKELHDELTWSRANRRAASARLLTRAPSDPRVPRHVPGPGEPVRRPPFYGDPNSEHLKGWPWPYGPWPGGPAGLWAWGATP
jgi:hypothetical protein